MNWGYKITIVICVFLATMLGMVYYASMQNNEMIDDHYYEKEMAYQSVIDAEKNLMRVSPLPLIEQNKEELMITFPTGTFEKMEEGMIEFLRNDAQEKDLRLPVMTNGSPQQRIDKNLLTKGIYTVRVKWTNDQKEYFRKENVYVNKI